MLLLHRWSAALLKGTSEHASTPPGRGLPPPSTCRHCEQAPGAAGLRASDSGTLTFIFSLSIVLQLSDGSAF